MDRPMTLSRKLLPDNPHIHFFESRRRGYVCVDFERAHMQVQMRVVSDLAIPRPIFRRCARSRWKAAIPAWRRLSSAVRLYADIRWPIVLAALPSS